MNKKVWIFQLKKEIAKRGEAEASWYVGWYDLQGKRHSESCGPGSRGWNQAEKRLRRIQSELDIGVHQPPSKKLWADFRKEYEEQVLSGLEPSSGRCIGTALDAFERHVKPNRVESITTKTIDEFVTSRRNDKGKKAESRVASATINKDLRHLKAALKRAHEWGYLPNMPKIRMVREPEKLPRFVTAEHFEIIYAAACDLATMPSSDGQKYAAADWWRALVVTAYMTGLRIKELLAIRREDVDFDKGILITRASDNKGKRDEAIPLHPVVIDHLRLLEGDDRFTLRWPHDPRTLWVEFGRIQRQAGIHLACPDDHKHTPACHIYGFHDFRRAFATVNAPRLKPETLQRLMRHKSYKTTLGYINLASQVDDAVANMPVPKVLRKEEPPGPKKDEPSDQKPDTTA
jgi:integrase